MRPGSGLAVWFVGMTLASAGQPVAHAAEVTLADALGQKPRQPDVEYDIPDPKTHKQCKINVVADGKDQKGSGWIVTGPGGQVLRRFMDTNGDGIVDQYSYYRNGLEVYRDIDSNANNKIDQSRWLNLGGMRWGIDANEDGKIDQWKLISAEEVSRIAVRALVTQDASLLTPLLITRDDLKQLGIKGGLDAKLLAAVADPAAKLKKNVTGSKLIHAKTVWLRFDASPPAVIPADAYKTRDDLQVYENAMAMVDAGNPQQPGLVNVGELLRVGDIWKLTGLPQPIEGKQTELSPGLVMFHILGVGPGETPTSLPQDISPKTQELVERLKKLLDAPPAPNAAKAAFDKYYKQVETVLVELVNESKKEEERSQWLRQLLDTLAAAVQSGQYPGGVERLKQLESDIKSASPKSVLIPYARYRRLLAAYTLAVQESKGKVETQQKVHEQWLADLEEFLDDHPKSEDAPDAGMQLANALEFAAKPEQARKWYQQIATDFSDSPAGAKARGATHRIDLTGKPLVLSGASLGGKGPIDVKQFRGKILLVTFWDTHSQLFAEELPQLKQLYDQYHDRGFEALGVNLDLVPGEIAPYLMKHQLKWPQIHEAGGLDSPPARAFGIISLPTMFLVDAEGNVTHRSATVNDIKDALQAAYDKN